MFIEELDREIVSKLFVLKEDSRFSARDCLKNLYFLGISVAQLLPSPILLVKILRLLFRINLPSILYNSQNLYSCRDNSVIPYLIKQILPNRRITLFQNSIRFDYDLAILASELEELGIDSQKLEGITFHCWTYDCKKRLKKYFGVKNRYLVDGSYRLNYIKAKSLSGKHDIRKMYDAVLISSYKGICEDRLPKIRKYINVDIGYDAYNICNQKMTKIFIEVCREKKLSVGVICRNEHPEEEKNFYLNLGFKVQELIRCGKNSGRFDSYDAIFQSDLIVGLGTSLLVEAENFMQKK